MGTRRETVLGRRGPVGLSVLVLILVVGWFSLIGASINCTVKLQSGLTFEVPNDLMQLVDFESPVERLTDGCGEVSIRKGPNRTDAIVIDGGGKHNIDYYPRVVYVNTGFHSG